MNSPYEGRFQVTQIQHENHDGLDLVGIDRKEIHATVSGTIVFANWENPQNHSQGFGQYVVIKSADGLYYHYGHLSEIRCKVGDVVKCTDVIGIEGNTGHSTGSHCHYCVRKSMAAGTAVNLYNISKIPNQLGIYDDGYRPAQSVQVTPGVTSKEVEVFLEIEGKKYSGMLSEV